MVVFQGTLLGRFSSTPTPPPCYRVNLSWANLSISNEKTNRNWHLKPLHFTSTKSPKRGSTKLPFSSWGFQKSPSKIWLLWGKPGEVSPFSSFTSTTGLLAWIKQSDAARANSRMKREGELRKPENINLNVFCSRKKTDEFFPTYGRLYGYFLNPSFNLKETCCRALCNLTVMGILNCSYLIFQKLALRSFLLSWCCISVIWVVVQCGVGRVLSECCTTGTQIAAQDPRYIRLYRILSLFEPTKNPLKKKQSSLQRVTVAFCGKIYNLVGGFSPKIWSSTCKITTPLITTWWFFL